MDKKINSYFGDEKEKRKLLITYGITVVLFILVYFFVPDETEGIVTVVPAVFLPLFIFYTKRILEGLILGTVLSFFMMEKGGTMPALIGSIQTTLQGETFAWFLMVCGTLGGIIALLQYVGASEAFSNFVANRVKSRKGVLLWTMILGFVIFIDDYINVLIRGTAMSKVTDRYHVSREFLAYVIDSSAAAAMYHDPVFNMGYICQRSSRRKRYRGVRRRTGSVYEDAPIQLLCYLRVAGITVIYIGVETFWPYEKCRAGARHDGKMQWL